MSFEGEAVGEPGPKRRDVVDPEPTGGIPVRDVEPGDRRLWREQEAQSLGDHVRELVPDPVGQVEPGSGKPRQHGCVGAGLQAFTKVVNQRRTVAAEHQELESPVAPTFEQGSCFAFEPMDV